MILNIFPFKYFSMDESIPDGVQISFQSFEIPNQKVELENQDKESNALMLK